MTRRESRGIIGVVAIGHVAGDAIPVIASNVDKVDIIF